MPKKSADRKPVKAVGHAFDDDSLELLDQIAELEAEGEKPSASRSLRKMIREKAQALGLYPKNKPKPPSKPK